MDATTDPDAKFKVQPISGAAFLFHQRQLPGRQANRKSLLSSPEPSSPDEKKTQEAGSPVIRRRRREGLMSQGEELYQAQ